MKSIKSNIKYICVAAICLLAPVAANAQAISNMYFNIDWQMNAPVGNSYADKISGWGMNFEGGYFMTPNVSVGGFISYHSNNKYIDRQTLDLSPTSSITSDQQHHIFQLPFGAAVRYTMNREGIIQPYVGAKVGANYTQITSQMNIYKLKENKWGFYTSPEIGVNAYVGPEKQYGIHVAAYYSYATNKTDILTYSIDGISNVGFRVGLAF